MEDTCLMRIHEGIGFSKKELARYVYTTQCIVDNILVKATSMLSSDCDYIGIVGYDIYVTTLQFLSLRREVLI